MFNICLDVILYLQVKKIIYLIGVLIICSVLVVYQGDFRLIVWFDLMSMYVLVCIFYLLVNIFYRFMVVVSKKKKNLLNYKFFNCILLLKQEKVINFERFLNIFVIKKKCYVKFFVIWRNIFLDSRYKRLFNIYFISE